MHMGRELITSLHLKSSIHQFTTMKRTINGFLNTYELDEEREDLNNHRPYWLEDDDGDDIIFEGTLYGVI